MGDFHEAIELLDLIKGVDRGGETSVKAEDVVLDNSGQWQEVEQASELLPHVSITIFTEALVVESINLGDLFGLVVAAQNGNPVRIPDFQDN